MEYNYCVFPEQFALSSSDDHHSLPLPFRNPICIVVALSTVIRQSYFLCVSSVFLKDMTHYKCPLFEFLLLMASSLSCVRRTVVRIV